MRTTVILGRISSLKDVVAELLSAHPSGGHVGSLIARRLFSGAAEPGQKSY